MKNTNKQILIVIAAILILAGITPSTVGINLTNDSASAYEGGEIYSESKTITIPITNSQDAPKDVTTCKPGTHLECNCVNDEQPKSDSSTKGTLDVFSPDFNEIPIDWFDLPPLPSPGEAWPDFDLGFDPNYIPNVPTELPKSPNEMFDPTKGGLMGYLGRYFGLVE